MRTICAVTVARSDWGIYEPVLRAIDDDPGLRLQLVVSGAHLTAEHGWTVNDILAGDFRITERVDTLLSADSPAAIAKSMGLGLLGFADVYQRLRPDLLLVLGDRYDMHAAALAAVPFQLPIAHLHGGEVTRGAMDDAFRHAITKYSHLHFTATEEHAARVRQLGEEAWRVEVVGAPALDHLRRFRPWSRQQLEQRLGIELYGDPILVTYHPETVTPDADGRQVEPLLQALEAVERPLVLTRSNADTHASQITRRLEAFVARRPHAVLVENLGTQAYFSLMSCAAAMVGNSSSGLIEAASFQLPVVNVGSRQDGRPRSANVIDVENTWPAIAAGLRRALSVAFRAGLSNLENRYGDGRAAARIVRRLREQPIDARLMCKQFVDLPTPTRTWKAVAG